MLQGVSRAIFSLTGYKIPTNNSILLGNDAIPLVQSINMNLCNLFVSVILYIDCKLLNSYMKVFINVRLIKQLNVFESNYLWPPLKDPLKMLPEE